MVNREWSGALFFQKAIWAHLSWPGCISSGGFPHGSGSQSGHVSGLSCNAARESPLGSVSGAKHAKLIASGCVQRAQVSTEGDAFTLAFHEPLDAVAWALNMQHALLSAKWPDRLEQHRHSCIRLRNLEDMKGARAPVMACGRSIDRLIDNSID